MRRVLDQAPIARFFSVSLHITHTYSYRESTCCTIYQRISRASTYWRNPWLHCSAVAVDGTDARVRYTNQCAASCFVCERCGGLPSIAIGMCYEGPFIHRSVIIAVLLLPETAMVRCSRTWFCNTETSMPDFVYRRECTLYIVSWDNNKWRLKEVVKLRTKCLLHVGISQWIACNFVLENLLKVQINATLATYEVMCKIEWECLFCSYRGSRLLVFFECDNRELGSIVICGDKLKVFDVYCLMPCCVHVRMLWASRIIGLWRLRIFLGFLTGGSRCNFVLAHSHILVNVESHTFWT